jgi:hypothetical protein
VLRMNDRVSGLQLRQIADQAVDLSGLTAAAGDALANEAGERVRFR